MGRIRRELALSRKSLIEAIERLVDGGNQRPHLAWNFLERQPDIGARRTDILGGQRCLPQRQQRAAEDRDIDHQKQQQDRQRDPADVPVEVIDNVVDQVVAVGEIFGRLHPHRLAADDAADVGAGDGGVTNVGVEELDRGRARVGGEDRCIVLQRGKQRLPASSITA